MRRQNPELSAALNLVKEAKKVIKTDDLFRFQATVNILR
jgi:hypothetical protein